MRFFPKTIITMIMILGSNLAYGFLSCPQTEQQYQSLLSRQGGSITSPQNQALLKQCYEEVKWQFEYHIRNQYPSLGMGGYPPTPSPGIDKQICTDGLFKGQTIDPNRCLIGQGGEMMEKFMKTFGF
uniref:Uncharacterized protein n=1 Tax=Candidatus Kentrum sp. LFY TaxID=2126342 RepID=A0A450WC03_9GAMM|nr:MAG: hypothetical protein BECKLFY1418C_GA0070996_100920 [Candidatus Kentron sp. LFY]